MTARATLTATVLLWALPAFAADEKKPFPKPKLNGGFTSADLPSGASTSARADKNKPTTPTGPKGANADASAGEPGPIKLNLEPYVWSGQAPVEKVETEKLKPCTTGEPLVFLNKSEAVGETSSDNKSLTFRPVGLDRIDFVCEKDGAPQRLWFNEKTRVCYETRACCRADKGSCRTSTKKAPYSCVVPAGAAGCS